MSNVDATGGIRYDVISTYKIADSQSLTVMDPLYLSSGKVVKYNVAGIVPNTVIGFAGETKSMGVLATVGFQEYIGVRRKGLMSFNGLIDAGSYTTSISIGTRVSLYCDGSGSYYVVANGTNPIGEVVEGSMDTAGSSTTILVEVDLTTENVQPGEIGWPLLVPTDSKIEFRDTGIFIQSSANGKLLISSDGTGADDITLTGNVTISNDLVVAGTFSGIHSGDTFTGTVQINDNYNLQFEGVSGDSDGLTIACDSSGDTTFSCTAGQIEVSSKDGVVKFVDTDAATDYVTITTVAASNRQVIAAEPSGLFRFKDVGDANNSDVLDLDLTDAASANKMTSAVGFEIETTAGAITLDAKTDITLDPEGNDIILGGNGAKMTLAATSLTIVGGDGTGDDLVLQGNSTDANPKVTLNGLGNIDLLIKDQDHVIKYDDSNYLKTEIASNGVATITTVGSADALAFATGDGNITLTAAGDIVLEATGADVTCNAQFTLTNTAADQFLVRYDGSNYVKVDVDDDGSTTLTTVGTNADLEFVSGTAGDITLDSTGDIILEAGGNDITMDSQLTITETTADQLVIAYDGSNMLTVDVDADSSTTLTTVTGSTAAHFEIATGTAGDITLDAAGDIVLQAAGGDVSCDAQLTLTNTSADQFVIQYDTSNYVKIDVDADGSTTISSTGNGAADHFEIATGTAGDIILDAAGNIELEATTTVTGDFSYTGHKDSQIMICNSANIIDSDWVNSSDGTVRLTASKTNKAIYIPIHGLKVGDEITGFRLLGQIESAGNTVQINADCRKVATGTTDVTDTSIAAMTEVEKTADFRIDSGSTFSAETIVGNTGYYILVSGTTGATTDVAIIGAEIDINRK